MGEYMPHIEIKCYPGRTEEQKKACALKVADAVVETLGCKLSSVSIAIKEIEQEDWKEKVWDVSIAPEEHELYKKPDYKC